jgi:hypothetical protein
MLAKNTTRFNIRLYRLYLDRTKDLGKIGRWLVH